MQTITSRLILPLTIALLFFAIFFLYYYIAHDFRPSSEIFSSNPTITIDSSSNSQQPSSESNNESDYPIDRNIRYRFMATNGTTKNLDNIKITTFSPLMLTSTQKLNGLNANYSFKIIEDELGNRGMEFTIAKMPPFAKQIIDVNAQLLLSKEPQNTSNTSVDRYLRDEKFLELENKEIKKLSSSLHRNNNSETIRAIYDWVKNSLTYSGYSASDRGAVFAIENKKGDCTEYAYLITALARINKIPSRIMAGFVYKQNAILKPYDFHNWVEVFIDQHWQIVDPLNDVFLNSSASHIAFRILGQTTNSSELNSQKGVISTPGIKIEML